MTLIVTRDSYAETYAKENNISYRYSEEDLHTHSYTDTVTTQPGCTTKGIRTYTCAGCGDSYTEEIAATGHSYHTNTVAATTANNGRVTTACTKCGYKSADTVIYAIKKVKLSRDSFIFNGKSQKPSIVITDRSGKTLKNNKDYTVSYPKSIKNVGSYNVEIKFQGNYGGKIKETFTITPKSTSVTKVIPDKKGFTIKWKKQANQTTGYEIAYSTDKKFKNGTKTVTVNKNKIVFQSISKLKAKKKYYVRIRTYKTVKGQTYYSDWSKSKTVTTRNK